MRRRKRALGQPSDIAFLLIIFFLLLAGVAADRMLEITPSSREDTALDSKEERDQSWVIIHVSDDGLLTFDDELRRTELREYDVVMRISEATRWEYVVDAIDTVTRLHPRSISCELWEAQ